MVTAWAGKDGEGAFRRSRPGAGRRTPSSDHVMGKRGRVEVIRLSLLGVGRRAAGSPARAEQLAAGDRVSEQLCFEIQRTML